ncbi:MAG TPA: hypothetical protein VJ302_09875 [Blastocatellia bacterium]|nr:hypothetical protein [Blastocatellia bacterium]
MNSKQADVELILKLYELRRDPLMRSAREWYFTQFQPSSAQEIVELMLSGFGPSRYYRMITSYWEMAASFVNNGGIDEQLFREAGSEYLGVFASIEPFIAEVRIAFNEPNYLRHLERLVTGLPRAPEVLNNRRRLLARWAQAEQAGR